MRRNVDRFMLNYHVTFSAATGNRKRTEYEVDKDVKGFSAVTYSTGVGVALPISCGYLQASFSLPILQLFFFNMGGWGARPNHLGFGLPTLGT